MFFSGAAGRRTSKPRLIKQISLSLTLTIRTSRAAEKQTIFLTPPLYKQATPNGVLPGILGFQRAGAGSPQPEPAKTSNLNPVSLDLIVQGLAANAEAFGGFEFVASGFFEHLDDGVALDAFQQREIRIRSAFTTGSDAGDG